MSTPDIPERLAQSMYGKTDKVNAAENDNEDFQAGYDYAMHGDAKTTDAISREWRLRGEPEPEGEAFDKFREWKRGFWAASMQRAVFKK